MSIANQRQVGGGHYKIGGEEHWDRIWRLYGRGYFVGCITKYVERYPYKAGVEDLKKAAHFLQKLIELEEGPIKPGAHYREVTVQVAPTTKDMQGCHWTHDDHLCDCPGFISSTADQYVCGHCGHGADFHVLSP